MGASQAIAESQPMLLAFILSVSLALSGCMTSLGYVPEYVKPKSDKTTLQPTYAEVKKWAMDVLDGYDSRATMNRQALYGGALLAAASVSAIAALAALGSNSSALVGLPIGTGFLSGVASVYQSEEKAAIYASGSRYIKGLTVLSEERVNRYRRDVAFNTDTELEASQKAVEVAQTRLSEAQKRETTQHTVAAEARQKAEAVKAKPTATASEKEVREKSARSLEDLVQQETRARMAAEGGLAVAKARFAAAAARYAMRQKRIQELKDKGILPSDIVKQLEKEESGDFASEFYSGEAICLQKDVNNVMQKVAQHLAVLDPKDLAARLRAVKASEGKADGGETTAPPPQIPPPDLSDLALPAKSLCDP